MKISFAGQPRVPGWVPGALLVQHRPHLVDFTILRPYEGSARGRKMLELAAPLGLVLSKFPIICGTELWEAAMIDLGGGLGMVITVLFVVILGAGLAYGIWASRHAPVILPP
jgi:hypothetical protein